MGVVHTAIAALLVAALSVAYGLKEQTKDLKREAADLAAREAALEREITLLDFEWRYATSPDRLARLAAALSGAATLVDGEGVPLAAWAPAQALRLQSKPPVDQELIETASTPGEAGE